MNKIKIYQYKAEEPGPDRATQTTHVHDAYMTSPATYVHVNGAYVKNTSPATYAHDMHVTSPATYAYTHDTSPATHAHVNMTSPSTPVRKDVTSPDACEKSGGTSPSTPVRLEGVGVKYDADKPDYSLLSFRALDEVVKTLTYGAKKYSRDNWKKLPGFHERYLAAALRHVTAHARGELLDPETGLHHLSHAVVSLMYIVEDSLIKKEGGSGDDPGDD